MNALEKLKNLVSNQATRLKEAAKTQKVEAVVDEIALQEAIAKSMQQAREKAELNFQIRDLVNNEARLMQLRGNLANLPKRELSLRAEIAQLEKTCQKLRADGVKPRAGRRRYVQSQ